MASWNEIERTRKNPNIFRPLARRLMNDSNCEQSEFADGFLENIANWKREEISLRQSEVLLGLRDNAEIYFHYKGLSVPILIANCYANRWDLDEGDRQRLEALVASNKTSVTGAQMGWFKRICKQLGEMEDYL